MEAKLTFRNLVNLRLTVSPNVQEAVTLRRCLRTKDRPIIIDEKKKANTIGIRFLTHSYEYTNWLTTAAA